MICPRCKNEMEKTETPNGWVCMFCGKGVRVESYKPITKKREQIVGLCVVNQYCPFCNKEHPVEACYVPITNQVYYRHIGDDTLRFKNTTCDDFDTLRRYIDKNAK